MNLVTPKKRPVDVVLADSATDDDDDDDDDEEARNVRGEAIDWHDHDLEIGPTPQKHGRVIGLFDHLSPPSASSSSSRTRGLPDVDVFVPPPNESTSSPGKRSAEMAFKHDRRKTTTTTTTTSTKSPLKTPVFLRRQVLRLDDDDDEGGGGCGSSTPRLLFPSMPKRGLSTLINELRELEDNEEDEGMNVLREMEASLPPPSETTKDKDEENEVLPDEKVKWKKKGLKRSHRRVIMRPAKPSTSKDNDKKAREGDDDDDSDEYINSADEAADDVAAMGLPKQTRAPTQADLPATAKTKGPAKKPGGVSQNFKSLKLRNSGAKGGSRFGRSRFGGRR